MFIFYQPLRFSPLKGFCLKLIYKVLSWRTRRMIFLSSLYGLAMDIQKPDISHAKKLSKVLNIAREPSSVELPMSLKSVIWKNHLTEKLDRQGNILRVTDLNNPWLSLEDFDALATSIVKNMPEWLKYAKDSQIKYDIRCMVKMMHKETGIA